MAKSTPHQRAKRWLVSHLTKLGMTRARSHPNHVSMEMKASPELTYGNLWIDASVDLYHYDGHPIRLSISGCRTGPEARSTGDGPIELSFPLDGPFKLEDTVFTEFNEAALVSLKAIVIEAFPRLDAAFQATLKRYQV